MVVLVYLVTGCSSGFGYQLSKIILARGDKVIAAGRDISKLAHLSDAGASVLELDITWPPDQIRRTVDSAVTIYGRIDVLINNAAKVTAGVFEDVPPEKIVDQFSTNVFGTLNVTRSVLPHLRTRRSGTIVFLGSVGAYGGGGGFAAYCATKAAISKSLNIEVRQFGIQTLCIEPGYFRTGFMNNAIQELGSPQTADYHRYAKAVQRLLESYNGKQPGDPVKGAGLVLDLVDMAREPAGEKLPVCFPMGSDASAHMQHRSEAALETIESWKDIIHSTDHDDVERSEDAPMDPLF